MRGVLVAFITGLVYVPAMAVSPASELPERVAIYQEAPDTYIGLGVFKASVESGEIDQSPGGFHVRAGGLIDPNWGLEVRLARGVWHERQKFGETRVHLDIDYIAAAYVTGLWEFPVPMIEIPMVQNLFAQAHLGVASVKGTLEAKLCSTCSRSSTSHDRADLSWGLGLGLHTRLPKIMPNKIALSLEYMDYGDKDKIDISTIEAGFQVFF